MNTQTYLTKNYFKIGQLPITSSTNFMGQQKGIFRLISLIFLASILLTNLNSCKTCKCPAYSKAEYGNEKKIKELDKNSMIFSISTEKSNANF